MNRLLSTIVALTAASALAGRLPDDPAASTDLKAYLDRDGPAAAAGSGDIGQAVAGLGVAMGDIAGDLRRTRTDTPVQTKQAEVASSLDAIIKELDKACNGKAGGSMNPTQGLKKSVLAGGPGGIGDLRDARAGEKQWGQLKPKDRDQILQSKTDGFPAGYETLLQSYYRRLASEDNAAPADAGKKP